MGHRMSSLPLAAMCPQAPILGERYGSGRSAAMSTAFHAMCASPDDPETHAKLSRLTQEERAEVESWNTPADWGPPENGLTYATAHKELEVSIALPGGDATIGHLDFAWVDERPNGQRWAIVCDIKRSRWTAPPDSLQIRAYTVAFMQLHDCTHGVSAVWDATNGEYIVADKVVERDSRSWYGLLASIEAAATHEGQAVTGAHCRECYGRMHCSEHLLPAAVGANEALAPLTSGGAITHDNALLALHTVKAMEDLVDAAKDALKSFVVANGPIVDGEKSWGPHMMPGRDGCSVARIRKLAPEMADKLITKGKPYEAFAWHKTK